MGGSAELKANMLSGDGFNDCRAEKRANSRLYSRPDIYRGTEGSNPPSPPSSLYRRALGVDSDEIRACARYFQHHMAPENGAIRLLGRFSEIYLHCEMSRCQDDERQLQRNSGIGRSSARATRFAAAEFRSTETRSGSLTPPTWEARGRLAAGSEAIG